MKINKIDKLLARWAKKKKEITYIIKIRNVCGDNTTLSPEKKMIVSKYYKQLYINKLDYVNEMKKFLKIQHLPR